MQIGYDDGTATEECELALSRPDATVADLARVLRAPTLDLLIDGRPTPGDTPLRESGLVVGATVSPGDRAAAADPGPAPVVVLRVVGGLCAGQSVPLPPGPAVVGRGRAAVVIDDSAVSRQHCRLDVAAGGRVTVVDLGSRNGTDVNGQRLAGPREVGPDDLVCLGGAVLLRVLPADAVEPPVTVDPVREAGAGGRVPWQRAPRTDLDPGDGTLPLPLKPERWAGVTRALRGGRRDMRAYFDEVDALRAALERRQVADLVRGRAATPDPAEILHRAAAPTARLWERRAGAPDLLRVVLGTADQAWTPPVHSDRAPPDPEVAEVLEELAELPAAPVPASLAAGHAIGLYGSRRGALAVARSLLCQAAVTSGPADLTIAVCTDDSRAADWDWAKWLPHTLSAGATGHRRLLAAGGDEVARLAHVLLDARARVPQPPVLLLVVDGATLLEGRPNPLREVLGGTGGPVAGILLTDRLPALCTATVQVAADSHATVHRLREGELVTGVLAAGLPEPAARACARALARFEDPELPVPDGPGAGAVDQLMVRPFRFPPMPA